MTLPGDPLIRRAMQTPVRVEPGASSFFSRPTNELDPAIMGNGKVLSGVRIWILGTLHTFWNRQGYQASHRWSTVWLAGSGITYQWSAGREMGGAPGDLDVLIGVDFPSFFANNPTWAGTPEVDMANVFNDQFRQSLDPLTAATTINGTTYEVTFYVNPAAADIRNIHPYAAYNLNTESWTVPPPHLPADWDPRRVFGDSWFEQWHRESGEARSIYSRYRNQLMELRSTGSPADVASIGAAMHHTLKEAHDWWESVHGERHKAFAPGGNGYADYYNARWQAHKKDGSIGVVHQLDAIWNEGHKDLAIQCYGDVIPDAQHATAMAAAAVRMGG